MRAIVVGVGAVGARAARQLLALGPLDDLVVVDPDTARRDAVVASLGRPVSVGSDLESVLTTVRGPSTSVMLAGPAGDHRAPGRAGPGGGGVGRVGVRLGRRRRRPARPRRRGPGQGPVGRGRGRVLARAVVRAGRLRRPQLRAGRRDPRGPGRRRADRPAPASTRPPAGAGPRSGPTASGSPAVPAPDGCCAGSPTRSAGSTATGAPSPSPSCWCPPSPASTG